MSNEQDRWIPRTNLERLIQVDALLAEIIPDFGDARERIVDTLPGHSGRPVGTGEPGAAGGVSASTVVERVQASWSRDVHDLDQLDRLAAVVVDRVAVMFPGLPGPADNGAVRRLVWARWAVIQVTHHERGLADRVHRRRMLDLHRDVEHLHRIAQVWARPRAGGVRSPTLAVDATEQWCRSCLRAGARNPRSDRYTADGLCRWCGDFQAEQGFLPSLEIIDARESGQHGSSIAKLIRAERRARTPRRARRGKRRGGA